MPVGISSLFFGGTEAIEPTGRDEEILNSAAPNGYFPDESDADEDIPYENPQTGERSVLKRAGSPADGDRPSKSKRVLGGRAAIPKRIVADYDSDDGRIIELKQQGYTDEYVANKLIQEDRIRYVPKTVGSRWLRLRKALAQAENERLDDELSDWHVGEDDYLQASVKAIDEKYEREMQKLLDKKWKEVSANLSERLHKKKYTGRACRERFDGLKDGTALLPIEIDPDKQGRKHLRDTRIAAAKQRRADEAAELQRAEDEKKAKAEARVQEAKAKELARITKAKEKEEKDNAELAMKEQRKADKLRAAAAKKAAAEQARAELRWEREQRRAEKAVYARLTGGKRLAGRGRRVMPAASRDDTTADEGDEEDAGQLSDDDDEAGGVELSDSDEEGKGSGQAPVAFMTSSAAAKKKPAPKVTKTTLLSPRSIMTFYELDVLLHERGLAHRGKDETHPQVVARICAADEGLPTPELHDMLKR